MQAADDPDVFFSGEFIGKTPDLTLRPLESKPMPRIGLGDSNPISTLGCDRCTVIPSLGRAWILRVKWEQAPTLRQSLCCTRLAPETWGPRKTGPKIHGATRS